MSTLILKVQPLCPDTTKKKKHTHRRAYLMNPLRALSTTRSTPYSIRVASSNPPGMSAKFLP